jgi:hypothetical protein
VVVLNCNKFNKILRIYFWLILDLFSKNIINIFIILIKGIKILIFNCRIKLGGVLMKLKELCLIYSWILFNLYNILMKKEIYSINHFINWWNLNESMFINIRLNIYILIFGRNRMRKLKSFFVWKDRRWGKMHNKN